MKMSDEITVIILAAGMGSRMNSNLPKCMHLLGGVPMIEHLIATAQKLKPTQIITVIGDDMPEVATYLQNKTKIAYQQERLGSAHAVLAAEQYLNSQSGILLILYTDTPLVDSTVLKKMITLINNKDTQEKAEMAVLGFETDKPNKYGKLITQGNKVIKILEDKESNFEEKQIKLCNSGVLAMSFAIALKILKAIQPNNLQKEYYLTDSIFLATRYGYNCLYLQDNKENLSGANTKEELAFLENVFQNKKRKQFLELGVHMVSPETAFFSFDSKIAKNVIIEPFVIFGTKVNIAEGVLIKSFSYLEGANIKKNAKIGPFARLRANTQIAENVHIGNFVELKNATVHINTKINHLSYIGDTEVGKNTNIGAGTITCNYDGFSKFQTTIGENCLIGSNTSIIAPIKINNNAAVAAGSVITDDVPEGSLAIERGLQANIENWFFKFVQKQKN